MKLKELRARQFMYMQDIDHLKVPESSLPAILKKSGAEEWAIIKHDQDKDKNGKIIRPHVHIVLKFSNPQQLSSIAKLFKDKKQYVDVWKGRINNAYSYLLHETTDAARKHHYSANDVVASFDFAKRMKQIRAATRVSRKFVNQEIDRYADGDISREQLQQEIGVVQMAKHANLIAQIDQILEEENHNAWLQKFNGHKMECLWLWGKAGVGKTTFAEYLFKNKDYVTLGSSRDHFQNYKGEHYIIINDLRPNDFAYSDLLTILDPYQHDKMAPSRYHDKYLNAEAIIITTPYNPQNFYYGIKLEDPEIDTEDQLLRRVQAIHVTPHFLRRAYKKAPQYLKMLGLSK